MGVWVHVNLHMMMTKGLLGIQSSQAVQVGSWKLERMHCTALHRCCCYLLSCIRDLPIRYGLARSKA